MAMETKNGKGSAVGRSMRSWPLWPLVFFLFLAAVSLLLHFEKSRCQERVHTARQRFDLATRAAPVATVKVQRARFYEIRYYLGYPSATSYAVADFVRRLCGIVQAPLQVSDLKIVTGWQNLNFELSAAAAADTTEAARRIFADFLQDMQDGIEISQTTFSEPAQPAPMTSRAARKFVFTMSSQVEKE
jgi:hypothetical protein